MVWQVWVEAAPRCDCLLDQCDLGIDKIPKHKGERNHQQFDAACSKRALIVEKHMPEVRCVFRSELKSSRAGIKMLQPLAKTRPDCIKRCLADEVPGSPLLSFPLGIRVVAQRRVDFVNHRLHYMLAEEPDGGLMHETPVDRAIQLKALVENAQLHNHIRAIRVKTEQAKQVQRTERNSHQTSCSSTA